MTIRYGSVCSGIEAATMAWHVLGWEPAFFSEIEKFPCAALAHHYPHVPNHGDMTKFQEWPDHAIDLLVGGTPCQSFSVAGLRAGLADPRGNLMLTYLAIAARYQPRWLVWENVPGVLSSNGGRDFGTFLRGLAELGYGFAYRVLDAQFCRAHGYEFAVPQRRRRVFVVGYLGDWRCAAAVLFDGQSLRGDSAPSRKAGQRTAGTIEASIARGRGAGTSPAGIVDVAPTMRAGGNATGGDRPYGTDVDTCESLVAHALRGEGFDASEDGTGRGTPIVPAVAASLTRGAESAGKGGYAGRRQEDDTNLVAFDTTQITSQLNRSVPKAGDPCHPLAAEAHPPAIAFGIRKDAGRSGEAKSASPDATGNMRKRDAGFNVYEGIAPTLEAGGPHSVGTAWAVRRLTPRECERLQGFPDDFTAIPYRGKSAADGPRYKALGNSMAVNVMRVLGTRIAMVDALVQSQEAAA